MTRSSSNPDSNPPSKGSGKSQDAVDKSKAVTRAPEAETQVIPGPLTGDSPLTGGRSEAGDAPVAGKEERVVSTDRDAAGSRIVAGRYEAVEPYAMVRGRSGTKVAAPDAKEVRN